MQSRRRSSTAYRSRPRRSGMTLPEHMKGVALRPRPEPNYPTVKVEKDETK